MLPTMIILYRQYAELECMSTEVIPLEDTVSVTYAVMVGEPIYYAKMTTIYLN